MAGGHHRDGRLDTEAGSNRTYVRCDVAGTPLRDLQAGARPAKRPAAWAAAAELPRISLEDALALCLLTAERQPARFERAASRWIARYLEEEPYVGLQELRLTTELLVSLPGPHAAAAARALHELFAARGRADLVEALDCSRRLQ